MIRLGLIGPGYIAKRVVNGAKLAENVEMYAVASRRLERAKEFALENDIPYHGTIDEMIADENIDAIYLATPNATHLELIKRCLNAGKHVMCEKAMLFSSDECNEAFALAKEKGLVLMEAHKCLFLPLTQKIKALIEEKAIGDLLYMDGKFSNYVPDEYINPWLKDAYYGGGLRDTGVYPIAYFNYLSGSKVKTVQRTSMMENDVDMFTQAVIQYENGTIASCCGGMKVATQNKAVIYGTKGYIEVSNFWKAGKGVMVVGGVTTELNEEMISDFKYEIEHFASCIENKLAESPIISQEASLEVIRCWEL